MRIGITGHQRLKLISGWGWVELELDNLLSTVTPPLIGITSLAIGSDQMFANAVLRHGGTLKIVVPFATYEFTFSEGHDRQEYARLLELASKVEVLEKHGSDEQAYFISGKRTVDQSDLLIAVWDGQPAAGLGGTADMVNYALHQKKRTLHLNPITHKIAEL